LLPGEPPKLPLLPPLPKHPLLLPNEAKLDELEEPKEKAGFELLPLPPPNENPPPLLPKEKLLLPPKDKPEPPKE